MGPFSQKKVLDFFLIFIQSPQFFCGSTHVEDPCFCWSIFIVSNSCYDNSKCDFFHSNHFKGAESLHHNHTVYQSKLSLNQNREGT